MSTNLINLVAVMLAFTLSLLGTIWASGEPLRTVVDGRTLELPADDATEVADSRGRQVPIRGYQRIVSLNTVADHLLLQLVEPERIVAVTSYSAEVHPEGWRFGTRPTVATSAQIEAVLTADPDLVIASKFTDEAYIARLLEEGVEVFDLGEMRGVETAVRNIRALSALLEVRDRGRRLEESYLRQLSALETDLGDAPRPWGLYLSLYADSLFGGTARTSYADMMRYGGVRDLAARKGYQDWPKYTPEQLLAMDPDLIITQQGMGEAICTHDVLRRVSACKPGGRVVEMPGTYHSDPGLGIVESAAILRKLVHGR